MVHPDTKVADEIFAFESCTVPVILRKAEPPDSYSVVGCAYIYNFAVRSDFDGKELYLL